MTTPHIIVSGLPSAGSRDLYEAVHGAVATGDRTAIAFRPCPDMFDSDTMPANLPADRDIRIIMVVKDPRDIVCAIDEQYRYQPCIGFDGSLAITPESIGYIGPGLLEYGKAIDAAMQRRDLTVAIVRHEELLHDPEGCRRRIAHHTGLAFERAFDVSFPDPAPIRAGARIVRQFRLAPPLFDLLARWGYETDRSWFDRLAESHPAGLDDHRGLIVGYHTDDPGYTREARRLRASIARFDLPCALTCIPANDWLTAVRGKVRFLKEQRLRRRGPLLYVDVDACFHGDPWPYLNGIDADVAWASLRDGKSRSGTILLADSPGALAFLDDWQARLDADRAAWDQMPLNDILRDARANRIDTYRPHLLPPAYCHIFDRAEALGARGAAPMIEHLQASRDLTSPGSAKYRRRQDRIAEIEAALAIDNVIRD